MCGFAGLLGSVGPQEPLLRHMSRSLRHRGPDDEGFWCDSSQDFGFAFRRLAVVELSPAGHQPMVSRCGRYVMVFNGEIYNHQELRKRIDRPEILDWRGRSDTETLLACISVWGLKKTLESAIGMFALGVWDREEHKLSIARDRIGEKPLYYGFVGQAFVFASELKALLLVPGFHRHIDRTALASFMRHSYIPAPRTIYTGIFKLTPGTWLEVSSGAVAEQKLPNPRAYWSALEQAKIGLREPRQFSCDGEAVQELDVLLRTAVAGQMVADVQLGAFLSGGIDSSTIVSLMQAISSHPVKTFSIGFNVPGYDEANYAKAVAQHLGTDHIELYLSPDDALAVIPSLPDIYDEPFADSSQIPTYLVARLARQHVTVTLSGDGGDELFGGYNRYVLAGRLWRYLRTVPPLLRSALAKVVLAPSPASWDAFYSLFSSLVPARYRLPALGDLLHKAARLLDSETAMILYRGLVSHWEAEQVVLQSHEPAESFCEADLPLPSFIESMMICDALTYLPDDVLVKIDRAAMAVSLETRVPLLDHRIFEFAWRLPLQFKLRGGSGKWLLRQVLHKYVPRSLVDRPKMGFGVPVDTWLRGPLRDWAEDLLDESKLRKQGYFDPAPIRRRWLEHLSGRRNWQHHLWDILMFEAWLDKQETRSSSYSTRAFP